MPELLVYELLGCTNSARPGAVIEQVIVWVIHFASSFATKARVVCLSYCSCAQVYSFCPLHPILCFLVTQKFASKLCHVL